MMVLIGAAVAGSIVLPAADAVPAFDVEPSCRAAALRAPTTPNYMEICRQSEHNAHQQILQRWSQFSASDKAQCVPVSSIGGKPTYTELLTCLEMTRDAKNLRRNDPGTTRPAATTGQGGK